MEELAGEDIPYLLRIPENIELAAENCHVHHMTERVEVMGKERGKIVIGRIELYARRIRQCLIRGLLAYFLPSIEIAWGNGLNEPRRDFMGTRVR